jgi:ADP-dependent NAD(P)H-hydrate dehydratase / NAD(P)H-hydrate epimerase
MYRITPGQAHALYDSASTRQLEAAAAALLPAHTLMQRAGLAVAQLARALAPHARHIWIACGPGNNGGDGLEAAMHLHQQGLPVVVTCLGQPERLPDDARRSWQRAHDSGVCFANQPPAELGPQDLCIDALLGLGLSASGQRAFPAQYPLLQATLAQVQACAAPVLAVDVPSGLLADSGQFAPGLAPSSGNTSPRHTLSLLTLKPGLFTALGRDAAGTVWFDDLACAPTAPPSAWLNARPPPVRRFHASHKGSYGDVAVVGGEGLHQRGMGMGGAALLAARAALHSGAGRVLLCLRDHASPGIDMVQPELMLRHFQALQLKNLTVVCGCGGGEAIRAVLPQVLAQSAQLVLDADALNAIAADAMLQQALQARQTRPTVLTPHPLEAARLLGTTVQQVQAQRLETAQQLAQRFGCAVVLKGSGSVIAAPGQLPRINPTGNARLASAGTGDVLAGMVGAALASGLDAYSAACHAVFTHGEVADHWPAHQSLTANALACQLLPSA